MILHILSPDWSVMTALKMALRTALGLDLGATRWRAKWQATDGSIHELSGLSRDHQSLIALLRSIFETMGFIPEALCLAMPGTSADGTFVFTNLDYPDLNLTDLLAIVPERVEIINDMQAAHLGAETIDRSRLITLKTGAPNLTRNQCILTCSTGVNWASGPAGKLAMPREGGHTRLALPYGGEHETLKVAQFVSDKLGYPASVEDLLGGSSGPGYIFDYLREKYDRSFDSALVYAVQQARETENGCGRLMSEGAMNGDPIWMEAAALYGKLLAYLLHQVVTADLVGELLIQGSVLNAEEGFAEWLFMLRFFGRIFVHPGMRWDQLTREVAIYGVPCSIELGVEGALARALSSLPRD